MGMIVVHCGCAVPMSQINGDRAAKGVVLVVEPETAKVYLDGRYIGRATDFDGKPNKLELTRGGHVLKFKAEGFENERVEVAGMKDPTTLRVKMLPRPKAEE